MLPWYVVFNLAIVSICAELSAPYKAKLKEQENHLIEEITDQLSEDVLHAKEELANQKDSSTGQKEMVLMNIAKTSLDKVTPALEQLTDTEVLLAPKLVIRNIAQVIKEKTAQKAMMKATRDEDEDKPATRALQNGLLGLPQFVSSFVRLMLNQFH